MWDWMKPGWVSKGTSVNDMITVFTGTVAAETVGHRK